MFAFEQPVAAEVVDRAMLGGSHEPRPRPFRDAGPRPLLERCYERLLRKLLGNADIAHHAGEAGDELCLLDAKDRIYGAVGVGSRHGYRLTHLPSPRQAV